MAIMNLRKQCGDKGEQLVAQFLEADGYCILARNYARRNGEVDLVAQRGQMVVFVEVKARTQSSFDLTEVVSRAKQKRIIAAAKSFIIEHRVYDKGYRFDVALIENLESEAITYIPNAFTEPEY